MAFAMAKLGGADNTSQNARLSSCECVQLSSANGNVLARESLFSPSLARLQLEEANEWHLHKQKCISIVRIFNLTHKLGQFALD